jgi:hypothetical protein
MAPVGLLHPQVDVDFDAVKTRISCGEYRPDINDLSLQTVDAITSRISEVWPEPPPDRHLHVFVSLPGEAGECFFFLLVFRPLGNALSLFSPPVYNLVSSGQEFAPGHVAKRHWRKITEGHRKQ